MPDEIRATPRNQLLGLLADAVQSGSDFASKPFGYDNPPLRGLLDLMGVPAVANTLKELSYGGALGTGSGMTWRPKADMVDAAMAVAPLVAAMPRTINTTAAAIGQKLEPGVNALVNRAMQQGGLSADILQAMSNKTISPAIVWHGSPHKFDRFDASKIGTGEGAQAYGHGLYLADAPDVAMTYQPRDPRLEQKIMQRYSMAERGQQYPAMQVYEDFLLHKTPQEVADNIAAAGYSPQNLKLAQAALKTATAEYHKQRAGALYKVDLPDNMIARMLDWDKPLSQQAPELRAALTPEAMGLQYQQLPNGNHAFINVQGSPVGNLQKGGTPAGFRANWLDSITNDNLSGRQVYQQINGGMFGADKASAALRQAGIPGIRYLDGGSRGAGAGSSNFVVFPGNEDMLTILERNGKPVGLLN